MLELALFANSSLLPLCCLSGGSHMTQKPKNADKLEALRREVMIGVGEYERGDVIKINSEEEMEQFFADIQQEVEAELAAERDHSSSSK
jgi:hypothetical protein